MCILCVEVPDGSYTLVPADEHEGARGDVHNVTVEQDPDLSVFWTGNLLRGVPEVDECDSSRSITRRKRHAAHNLDRFGPRGA
jgi:hypothetical protein